LAQRGIRELPLAERPRERLAAVGAPALSSVELLAVLWGSGTPAGSSMDVASAVLAHHGGLAELARADLIELTEVPGIGGARAAQETLSGEGTDIGAVAAGLVSITPVHFDLTSYDSLPRLAGLTDVLKDSDGA